MELMMILFLHLIGYLFVVLLGVLWVAFQAWLIKKLGGFGICLVSAIHTIGPVLLLAALVG